MTEIVDELVELRGLARQVPLSQLRPAPWNPRTIRSERFRNLCRSIQDDPKLLQLRPILAQADGEIYAGNMRYLAAKQIGWSTVWAVVDDVSPQLARERGLKDNNGWGEFDEDKLADMMAELRDLGTDVELLGFTDKQLQALGASRMPAPGDQGTDETERMFGVVVTCSDETQQVELLERLTEEGYDVRALVS